MLDKRVIVTGGTYGMGESIVQSLVADGATVANLARSADVGAKQEKELGAKHPGKIRYFRCDVSNRPQVKSAVTDAVNWMGGLDALVHVAGVEGGAPPEAITDEDWDYVMNINAKGTMIVNQEVFPHLKEKGGRIINFSAGTGVFGSPINAAYNASKGAVTAWTRSVAMAWGKYNITVNCICPAVWTPMYDEYRARLTPEGLEAHDKSMAQRILIGGKLGDPARDLAPVINFLVSDGARYITGQTIPIDGGVLMVR